MHKSLSFGSALLLFALPAASHAQPVLFISIDGLRPADVLEASQRGLAIPNIRRFVTEGSFAHSVTGVTPTVTYPSHTTLVTGTSPARHGIFGNTTFDPAQINRGGWYWYADDIAVTTLWDAAAKAGLSTASVHWPVTVGQPSIKWNLPQIWRTGHSDDAKLVRSLSTPGLVEELEKSLGAYAQGIDESIEGDENRTRFSVRLIETLRPDFITVYLTALDHQEHADGPGTSATKATLERIDALVGQLVAAEQKAHPDAVIAIASDHGFAAIDTETNLFRAFIDNGLINVDAEDKVVSWEAMPWPAGGSAAIVLARPDDKALQTRVARVLDELKANPDAKIADVVDAAGIKSLEANPLASYYVNFRPGATAGGFKGNRAPLIGPSASKGTHGYFASTPEMRSSFMMLGYGVAAGRNLGDIDMRQIAPTLAAILGVDLPQAEGEPLR